MLVDDYLSHNFPNLILKAPLFYNYRFGLRYELGKSSIGIWQDKNKQIINHNYFIEADKRVKKLFESVFDANDEVIIVCQRYSDGRQKIKKNTFCYKYITYYTKIESHKIRDPYYTIDDSDLYHNKEHWHQIVIHTNVSAIDHDKFLWRSIRNDFGYGGIETYFINKTKNIIFYNYDDRGLDIIAKDKESLLNIYQEFNSWILDYDRKNIDLLFKD